MSTKSYSSLCGLKQIVSAEFVCTGKISDCYRKEYYNQSNYNNIVL